MRTILISGVAILLSSAALPATAAPSAVATTAGQDGSQASAQTDNSSQPRQRARGSERQICVNEAMSTGRIRRRVCHTQAEWNVLQANDEQ
jgi:hypothetical protein